jgi:fructoselysine 6-kinase
LFHRDRAFSVPAGPIEALDTLGAGDTFIARTLYGLCSGEEPALLLREAVDAAADTCRYFGATGHGAPTEISVDLGVLLGKLSG